MKDHYQTLGLNNNASQKEIKKAYKKLAFKFHPDKNNGDSFFEQMFREVKGAYDVLSNPRLKKEYDSKRNKLNDSNKKNTSYSQYKTDRNERKANKTKQKKYYKKRQLKINYKLFFILFSIFAIIIAYLINGIIGIGTFIILCTSIYFFLASLKSRKINRTTFLSILVFAVIGHKSYNFIQNRQKSHQTKYEHSDQKNKENSNEVLTKNKSKTVIKTKDNIIIETDRLIGLKEFDWMDEDTKKSIREINESSKKLESNEYKEKFKTPYILSKYRGNQLKNGASPLNACFGKGIYSQSAWLKFKNSNRTDAIVCLVRSYDKKNNTK